MKYCTKCGNSAEDDTPYCLSCGTRFPRGTELPAQIRYEGASGSGAEPVRQKPAGSNEAQLWMILNIVAAVLCCLIPAIVGIVFGAIGMDAYSRGDYVDAEKKTSVAKVMFILSVCLGALAVIVFLISTCSSRYRFYY